MTIVRFVLRRIVALVLTLTASLRGDYPTSTVLAYLAALFGLVGALAGGGVAVAVEAVLRRRAGCRAGTA